MINKNSLEDLLVEALENLGGSGTIVQICKYVWSNYSNDLERSGDIFYTWQYNIRWAATNLRSNGKLKPAWSSPKGVWELK